MAATAGVVGGAAGGKGPPIWAPALVGHSAPDSSPPETNAIVAARFHRIEQWYGSRRTCAQAERELGPRRQYGAAVSDQPNLHDWKPLVEDLTERREKALGMGGPALLDRQRSMGKLPVRERIDLLLDHGSFVEFGQLADSMDPVIAADKGYLAADGMVAGVGLIDGRRVAVCAYDFTVMAGSMGQVGEHKTERLREVALRQRIPIVWLLDSAGRASRPRRARHSPKPDTCSASRSR